MRQHELDTFSAKREDTSATKNFRNFPSYHKWTLKIHVFLFADSNIIQKFYSSRGLAVSS